MSDEVIKYVIIEKQKSVTQLFPHTALTKDAGLGELQLAWKKQQGEETIEKMVCQYLLHPSPLLYPRIYPFSDSAWRTVANENL